jgi:hypothetical protein
MSSPVAARASAVLSPCLLSPATIANVLIGSTKINSDL